MFVEHLLETTPERRVLYPLALPSRSADREGLAGDRDPVFHRAGRRPFGASSRIERWRWAAIRQIVLEESGQRPIGPEIGRGDVERECGVGPVGNVTGAELAQLPVGAAPQGENPRRIGWGMGRPLVVG